jgi:hypothetical protein
VSLVAAEKGGELCLSVDMNALLVIHVLENSDSAHGVSYLSGCVNSYSESTSSNLVSGIYYLDRGFGSCAGCFQDTIMIITRNKHSTFTIAQ